MLEKQNISIHPPLAGWDLDHPGGMEVERHFNPPTPCGVGLIPRPNLAFLLQFQSTHPLRGGTRHLVNLIQFVSISIHPPLAGWDLFVGHIPDHGLISIHPPLAGWDVAHGYWFLTESISIHPPLAGWDLLSLLLLLPSSHFNPPTPCGVGHVNCIGDHCGNGFQSTHPLRGGTVDKCESG